MATEFDIRKLSEMKQMECLLNAKGKGEKRCIECLISSKLRIQFYKIQLHKNHDAGNNS